MTALLRSELKRLGSRRFYRWLVGLWLLGLTIGGVVALVRTNETTYFVNMVENVESIGFPLLMLAWVIGASAIGGEWQHRTVSALLTWEPRRVRVLAAKLVATSIFVVLVVLLLDAFFTLVMVPATAAHGSFDGVDSEWWTDLLGATARSAAAAVLASWLGFGLATIGKNTGAALGAGFVYLVVAEPMIHAWKPHWNDWFLGPNLGRIVFGGDSFGVAERSAVEAGAVLLLWGAVVLGAATWFFRRREIA